MEEDGFNRVYRNVIENYLIRAKPERFFVLVLKEGVDPKELWLCYVIDWFRLAPDVFSPDHPLKVQHIQLLTHPDGTSVTPVWDVDGAKVKLAKYYKDSTIDPLDIPQQQDDTMEEARLRAAQQLAADEAKSAQESDMYPRLARARQPMSGSPVWGQQDVVSNVVNWLFEHGIRSRYAVVHITLAALIDPPWRVNPVDGAKAWKGFMVDVERIDAVLHADATDNLTSDAIFLSAVHRSLADIEVSAVSDVSNDREVRDDDDDEHEPEVKDDVEQQPEVANFIVGLTSRGSMPWSQFALSSLLLACTEQTNRKGFSFDHNATIHRIGLGTDEVFVREDVKLVTPRRCNGYERHPQNLLSDLCDEAAIEGDRNVEHKVAFSYQPVGQMLEVNDQVVDSDRFIQHLRASQRRLSWVATMPLKIQIMDPVDSIISGSSIDIIANTLLLTADAHIVPHGSMGFTSLATLYGQVTRLNPVVLSDTLAVRRDTKASLTELARHAFQQDGVFPDLCQMNGIRHELQSIIGTEIETENVDLHNLLQVPPPAYGSQRSPSPSSPSYSPRSPSTKRSRKLRSRSWSHSPPPRQRSRSPHDENRSSRS